MRLMKNSKVFYGVSSKEKSELFPQGICCKILLDVSNNSITFVQ
jgi:hypothetical protein